MAYEQNINVYILDINIFNVYICDMNSKKQSYDNSKRLIEAENTRHEIINAFGKLWTRYSINEITLDMVSNEAGVTTRTIMRKFGSKEGLLSETLPALTADIESLRTVTKPGDIDEILQVLLSNYETMGEAAIRTINLEPELEIAREIGREGRELHRRWCIEVFSPYLPKQNTPEFEIQLASFIAATEIYLWKLIRKDLKLSKEKTRAVFKNLIEGLAKNNYKKQLK